MKRLVLMLACVIAASTVLPGEPARAEILAIRVDPPWVLDGDPDSPYGMIPGTGPISLDGSAVNRTSDTSVVSPRGTCSGAHGLRFWQRTQLLMIRLIGRFVWNLG
jgi:hypothetical protein